MPFNENYQPSFLPARLCENPERGIFVVYATANVAGKLTYKYIRLNKYRSCMDKKAFDAFAANMVRDINLQLVNTTSAGAATEGRACLSVRQALDKYLDEKGRELRSESMRAYRSFCSIFASWMEMHHPSVAIGSVQKMHAVKFMEWYYTERGICNNSFNNNLKWGRCLFEWLISHCYYEGSNPFDEIKRKRGEQKKRILIDAATRKKISDYLTDTEQWGFLLALHLVYSALLRPKEIAELHVGDVKDRYIVVPASVAKNHHERNSAITPQIAELLRRIHFEAFPSHYFLLGSEMMPARSAVNVHRFTKKWQRLREILKLPQQMQLYSLRDSGISDLLRHGVDAVSVMHHADHHSLDITTRYANHVDAHLVDMMYNRKEGF